MERPSVHQVVKPLVQDGTALPIAFLIDGEILLRKYNVVPFRPSMPSPTHFLMQIFTGTGLYLQHPV